MNKNSIKKNYIYNVIYQILTLLVPLVTTPYLSRILGADGIGKVSFAESIVSYFVLAATMGITTYGQREISYVQDSAEQRSIVFWNTKFLEFATAGIALFVFFLFTLFQQDKALYMILSMNIAGVLFDVTWFFQGMEEFGKIVFRNSIFKLGNVCYVFVVINTKNDVLRYAFGLALFTMLSSLSMWGHMPKYVERIRKEYFHPFRNLGTVVSLFIPTVAIQIYTVLDKTMIGLITHDSFENGYYEQAIKLSKAVLALVTALGTVMVPRIGYHFIQREQQEVQRLMYRGYRFVWCIGTPLCIGLIVLSDLFVPWFYGVGFGKVSALLKILALLILAIGINNVTGIQYLIPTKRQNTFTFTVIVGAATNFALNMLLIPQLQSMGAAIASVIAETVIAVIQLIIVREELRGSKIIMEGMHYFVAAGIMYVCLRIVIKHLSATIVDTVFAAILGVIVYFGILVVWKDEFLFSNLKSIMNKFCNVKRRR